MSELVFLAVYGEAKFLTSCDLPSFEFDQPKCSTHADMPPLLVTSSFLFAPPARTLHLMTYMKVPFVPCKVSHQALHNGTTSHGSVLW